VWSKSSLQYIMYHIYGRLSIGSIYTGSLCLNKARAFKNPRSPRVRNWFILSARFEEICASAITCLLKARRVTLALKSARNSGKFLMDFAQIDGPSIRRQDAPYLASARASSQLCACCVDDGGDTQAAKEPAGVNLELPVHAQNFSDFGLAANFR
jgi:hypothetical protein